MLHYSGDMLALELGREARKQIWLYEKKGATVVHVPFFCLEKQRKRFVKFEKLADQWVFVDIVDKE